MQRYCLCHTVRVPGSRCSPIRFACGSAALLAIGPRRPSVVAGQLGISRSTATRHLRLLEAAGLVVRDQSDHRRPARLDVPDRPEPPRCDHRLAGRHKVGLERDRFRTAEPKIDRSDPELD